MTSCCRDDCSRPVGRNGIGCHEHFTEKVPGFVARAFFGSKHPFTKKWLAEQVRHAIRDEAFTP